MTSGRSRSFSPQGRASRWTVGRCVGSAGGYGSASPRARGLVLHQVGYEDGERVRPIIYRASFAELVVPYGDPGPAGYRKTAFDIGEYGLGAMTNSLELGCDCLGHIHYFDVDLVDDRGVGYTIKNAICLHEEDFGLQWKHYDFATDHAEARRMRHQHFFCVRLDMQIDGERNTVQEVHTEAVPRGDRNPHGNAFRTVANELDREPEARRVIDPLSARHWKIINPTARNSLGEPVAYKLVPGSNVLPFADAESDLIRRAPFVQAHLWVTHFDPAERFPAGEYPNQNHGADGLPAYQSADRSIVDDDIVVWYTFGSHHIARPEDWPVMPVERLGFALKPVGFFDRNPGLDVPPVPHSGHGSVRACAPEATER